MAKMVKCKTCGKEIAKSAKVCPNCGAKQHQGVNIACGIIGLIMAFAIIGIVLSSTGGDTNTTGTGGQTDAGQKAEVIKISAEDLYSAYVENAVNADNLYKNKTIEITGTVTNIGQDAITKNPCISLASGDALNIYPVQCFFSSSNDQIAALRDGDTVTIVGKCTGYSIAFVQLSGCKLQ